MTMVGQFRWRNIPPGPNGVRFAATLAGLVILILCGLGRVGVRMNASPSLPIGLYVTTQDARSSLVEFCPDEPAASLGISRGYRAPGNCPDGATPLLKPVVAVAGDVVDVSAGGLAVNGRLLPNTKHQAMDSHGRPMPTWPEGLFHVAPDTVWVVSSYHRQSFDSRYFGPIRVGSIRNHVRPLLTE
jgi:conjugative transfer signal peptidase TraF